MSQLMALHPVYYQFFLGYLKEAYLVHFFFLVYINDLPEQIDYAFCYLFTHTKFLKFISTITDNHSLQTDINNLSTWQKEGKLVLNNEEVCYDENVFIAPQTHM